MSKQIEFFDGDTYNPEFDGLRLTGQLYNVWKVIQDRQWHTLSELSEKIEGSEAGISARLRDFRKERFGSHTVEKERLNKGLWRYRLK